MASTESEQAASPGTILDLLKGNKTRYDPNVIKAIIYTLSVFPLGTFVLLSNGARGVVVGTNPKNPRFPRVRVLGGPDGTRLSNQPVLQTADSEGGVVIGRALSPDEVSELRR